MPKLIADTTAIIDQLDRADMFTLPAISATATLARLFDAARDEDFTGRDVADLLRCVSTTAARGWPRHD